MTILEAKAGEILIILPIDTSIELCYSLITVEGAGEKTKERVMKFTFKSHRDWDDAMQELIRLNASIGKDVCKRATKEFSIEIALPPSLTEDQKTKFAAQMKRDYKAEVA